MKQQASSSLAFLERFLYIGPFFAFVNEAGKSLGYAFVTISRRMIEDIKCNKEPLLIGTVPALKRLDGHRISPCVCKTRNVKGSKSQKIPHSLETSE
ncbi:hypothetical protein AVEN_60322-1 [Araneus ventricosus]|uniref:Uncharacterized protein n=1 Tax=Araneus ventricosus TaxID=182803 RepID=A0A4Y2S0T9_ARAVE|nr:hypothetical protein AVEN_60322-1 [Araneus ventricosus]